MDNKFDAWLVYDMIQKLMGRFLPIGESDYDAKCMENIKQYDQLITMLIVDIISCMLYQRSQYKSVKDIGDYAAGFVDKLREITTEGSGWGI